MKLLIDSLDNDTGWVVNDPSTIEEISEPKYIAALNTKSLMIKFDDDDDEKTATKVFDSAIDVSDYETLVFSIWSQQYGQDKLYIKPGDFNYRIDLGHGFVYYVPIYSYMTDINLAIDAVNEITQIKFTSVVGEEDVIIISEMVAELEEIPLDILDSVKETIDRFIENKYPDGLLLGTATAATGDTELSISNPDYLDRYGVFKIKDDTNSETHQISDSDAADFQLNDSFDGDEFLHDFVAANVYLQFPTYINPGQNEIRLPGISIWGIDPEPVLRGAKLDKIRTSFTDTDSTERTEGQIWDYTIYVDCDARVQSLIDIMARIVRRFIAQESLWINGRRHDIYFAGKPTEFKPQTGIDYIPKLQYQFNVEVKENIFDRQVLPKTTTITVDVAAE